MQRRSHSLVIALCASLTLHALMLSVLAWWYVMHATPLRLEALARPEPAAAPIIIQSAPKPPPPPPPDFSDATKAPLRDDSGEADGHGTANRSTPGDRPMEAARGLEQANLSRDATNDVKSKSEDALMPAQAGKAIDDDADDSSAPPPTFGMAPIQKDPVPQAVHSPEIAVGPMPTVKVTERPTEASQTPAVTPPADSRKVEGHSTIASDTESPPFAKANSVRFHNGKMEGRQGRKVKTTRIDFLLGAMSDSIALGGPSVVLGVTVDANGFVQNVVILRSSGSDNIDLPSQRSIYNWWFEPRKDKDGRPLPDSWVVTID